MLRVAKYKSIYMDVIKFSHMSTFVTALVLTGTDWSIPRPHSISLAYSRLGSINSVRRGADVGCSWSKRLTTVIYNPIVWIHQSPTVNNYEKYCI